MFPGLMHQGERILLLYAPVVVQNHPVPMAFVEAQDIFGESGTDEGLFAKYGRTPSKVVEAARGVMKRRGR